MIYRILFLFSFINISVTGYGQELYFPPSFSEEWETMSHEELDWCQEKVDGMNEFLEETNSKAFIILKDGKIAMESYFDDQEVTSPWYWASAGKTMTALMTGIIQEEGLLSISDPTSDYLGSDWTDCTEEVDNITIRHQLTMTTGFDYLGSANCTEPSCLTCLNEPGTEWFYHNAPYTLITNVLEAATEEGYTGMTNSRVANPLGFIGAWIATGDNRVFYSTARGMARFGLLMLAEGRWDDEVILADSNYFQEMITPSQSINESYGYLWWLNGQETYRLPGSTFTFLGSIVPNAPDDMYAAIGKNGQICMVVPSENLVIIRMGDNPDQSLVPLNYVRELWEEYEKLSCTSSTSNLLDINLNVRPRLANNTLYIDVDGKYEMIEVIDPSGRVVMEVGQTDVLDISNLRRGFYFVRIKGNKRSQTVRIYKI